MADALSTSLPPLPPLSSMAGPSSSSMVTSDWTQNEGGKALGRTRNSRVPAQSAAAAIHSISIHRLGRSERPNQRQPAITAPAASAFTWGATTPHVEEKRDDETWHERAMRGPTPDNPSASLRKRLKRAAFFDKRDREVAAGVAKPVDTDAGLPENMDTRELELA